MKFSRAFALASDGLAAFARRRIFRGPLARFADAVLGPNESGAVDDEAASHSSAAAASPPESRRLARVRVGLREGYYAWLLLTVMLLNRNDNPFMLRHFGSIDLPVAAQAASGIFYIPQGWSLFAPEAPKFDVMLVVDAVRWDGTHVDPLRHAPPDFDAMNSGPYHTDYLWQTYVPSLVISNSPDLWRFFVDYLERIPSIEGWTGDPRFRSIHVYYVGGERHPFGQPPPPSPPAQLYAERVYVPAGAPVDPSAASGAAP